jgi:Glycine-rich domain-containing protein-like
VTKHQSFCKYAIGKLNEHRESTVFEIDQILKGEPVEFDSFLEQQTVQNDWFTNREVACDEGGLEALAEFWRAHDSCHKIRRYIARVRESNAFRLEDSLSKNALVFGRATTRRLRSPQHAAPIGRILRFRNGRPRRRIRPHQKRNMKTTDIQLVEIDLNPIIFKMQCEGETIDGEPIDFANAELAYRRFLTLHREFPDRTFVPSVLIDLVWHYHILDTRKYSDDCRRALGYFLHHDPYFGLGSNENLQANHDAWMETCALWERVFSEPMIGQCNRCSSSDCR